VNRASRFSFTALTLPGRVTTRVFPMVPATGRESDASRVCFKEEDRIRWINPGAWRSISGDTAYERGKMKGLNPKNRQREIQYLWCYVPHAEARAARGNDEVYGVRPIVKPGGDRLTDELCVIGDDFGVKDMIAVSVENVGCCGPGLV